MTSSALERMSRTVSNERPLGVSPWPTPRSHEKEYEVPWVGSGWVLISVGILWLVRFFQLCKLRGDLIMTIFVISMSVRYLAHSDGTPERT